MHHTEMILTSAPDKTGKRDKLGIISHISPLKPPSHSDKDHKDRTALLKLDKRSENGTKCKKKHKFQVCSTFLLHSCQDVTASNTSQLCFVARLIMHAPRPLRSF